MIQKSLCFVQRLHEDCVRWRHICFTAEGLHLPGCCLSIYLTCRFLLKSLYEPDFHSCSKTWQWRRSGKPKIAKFQRAMRMLPSVCSDSKTGLVGTTEQNWDSEIIPFSTTACDSSSFWPYAFVPRLSLSSLNLLSQIMHVFPLAEGLQHYHCSQCKQVVKSEAFQGGNGENLGSIVEVPCEHCAASIYFKCNPYELLVP